MNVYNSLGPEDHTKHTDEDYAPSNQKPCESNLKNREGFTYSTFHTNTSLLPDWVIAFCSLQEKEKNTGKKEKRKILPQIFPKEIFLFSS